MLFSTLDGEGVRVEMAPRHQEVVDDLIVRLRDAGHTVIDIAAVLNRSREYVHRRLKRTRERADTASDPGAVPVFGADPNWGPKVERRDPTRSCRRCGGECGPIEQGSPFVCLACLRSGQDDRLTAELEAERARARAADEARRARRDQELAERRRKKKGDGR